MSSRTKTLRNLSNRGCEDQTRLFDAEPFLFDVYISEGLLLKMMVTTRCYSAQPCSSWQLN